MKFKVCITAAGKGTRLNLSNEINKAQIPINNQSIISRIINFYTEKTEIIIAVGYKKNKLKSYLMLAFPKHNIKFVNVDKFEGYGSGPGYSLLKCKKHLQCPFVLFACDTIVKEKPPKPNYDWMGISKVINPESYLVLDSSNKKVINFFDKKSKNFINKKIGKNLFKFDAFIGLAGINNYLDFWKGLVRNKKLYKNELQVSNGFHNLQKTENLLYCKKFTWLDTGTNENFLKAKNYFKDKFLFKEDEFLYIENGNVIKYFSDKDRCNKRFLRTKYLNNINPITKKTSDNYLSYKYKVGSLLSETNNVKLFNNFLNYLNSSLWKNKCKNKFQLENLKRKSLNFYKNKTYLRVNKLLNKHKNIDKIKLINGEEVKGIKHLLRNVNWDYLSNGNFSLFHGDPQPENVIVNNNNFTLIDWREDFDGSLKYGDLYYDLGKIHHALIVSGKVIRSDNYSFELNKDSVKYNFLRRKNLTKYLNFFENFILENNYDLQKVRLLSSIIFLNISGVHHFPYSNFLFFHGKLTLSKLIKANE